MLNVYGQMAMLMPHMFKPDIASALVGAFIGSSTNLHADINVELSELDSYVDNAGHWSDFWYGVLLGVESKVKQGFEKGADISVAVREGIKQQWRTCCARRAQEENSALQKSLLV